MPASGAIPVKFPPAPTQTHLSDQTSLSGFSKQWVFWFNQLVDQITKQISQIIGLSFQNFTQATLPALTPTDAGALIHVTDYNHILQWTGTGWEWGPGENGGGFIQGFLRAPMTLGWHLCDGSTVNLLNGDGTVSSITLPDYTTAAYVKFAKTLLAGPNSPGGQTDPTDIGSPSGLITAPIFTGATGTTGIESADLSNVAVTGAATAAAASHTHSFTPTGTVSAPNFSGSPLGAHTHGPGNLDLENTQLLAYFRQ